VVERKVMDNFCASLSDGTLGFQMQRPSELQAAAVVVEGRFSALFKLGMFPVPGSPMCWHACRSGIPRFRSSSPTRASSPRSGPTDSSPRPSQMQPVREWSNWPTGKDHLCALRCGPERA
jgi:hypothetical protein